MWQETRLNPGALCVMYISLLLLYLMTQPYLQHVCECVNYTQGQHVYSAGLISWFSGQTRVSLLSGEPTVTSASANTPAVTMAPHKDISGLGGGREAGGIMLDTFIGEVCAPPLLSSPTVSSFFSIGVCTAACSVYRIIKELLRLPWLQHPGPGPAPSICLSLSPLPLAFPLMATALH